jgi:hypothetical protein
MLWSELDRGCSHTTSSAHSLTLPTTLAMPRGGRGGRGARGGRSRGGGVNAVGLHAEDLENEAPLTDAENPAEAEDPVALDPLPVRLTIADALREKANAQRRLNQLQERIMANSRVEAGSAPLLPPGPMLQEVALLLPRIQLLNRAIMHTNYVTAAPAQEEEHTASASSAPATAPEQDIVPRLIDLILQRDAFASVSACTKKFTDNVAALDAAPRHYGAPTPGVKYTLLVPYASFLKQQEGLDRQRQQVEARIQYLNSRTLLKWPTPIPPVEMQVVVVPRRDRSVNNAGADSSVTPPAAADSVLDITPLV